MAKRISQSFLINREENYRAMMQFLVNRNPEIEWEVVIREYKSDRSLDQNRLLWKWHQEWAEQAGYTKEYAHNRFKYKYVLPILLRDDEDGQITRVWELVRNDKARLQAWLRRSIPAILPSPRCTRR